MTKEQFCDNLNNDVNHRLLLWLGLEATSGKVVEYGSGHGSTPYLREYCTAWERPFETYDYNKEWAERMSATHVTDWDSISPEGSVILIDHSPGERRRVDLAKLADRFEVIVVHDTEPTGAGDYQVRPLLKQFKYVAEIPTNGAWASVLSNTIDVTKWEGESHTNNSGTVYEVKGGARA